jgi:beta-glucosidase-like glycosyl hydrolase
MLIFVDLTGSLPKTTTLGSTPTEGSPITEELTKTARVISEEVKKLGLTAQVNFEP